MIWAEDRAAGPTALLAAFAGPLGLTENRGTARPHHFSIFRIFVFRFLFQTIQRKCWADIDDYASSLSG